MSTTRALNVIRRDRDRAFDKALRCDVADLDVYAARVARCNLVLRKLVVRAARRAVKGGGK